MKRATAAALLALLWPVAASAVTIELKDVAPDRIERQRKFVEGSLPLPNTPDLSRFPDRLAAFGAARGAPVMLRVFKAESELEVWLQKGDRFELFATYPVCHWSGTLGPKLKEGDKQTPEGFYTVTRRQLHRVGRHPRSLNLGFPNAYDKSLARSGSYILVHGACSSVGCFAMTNAVMEEIYDLAEAAIRNGQEHLPVHVFPFRMTAENMAKHGDKPWVEFWSNLKAGYDAFEKTRRAPRVSVCNGRYEFQDAGPEEVGAPSPLAVCGASAAAIEALEPLNSSAALRPLLWQRAKELLTPGQLASWENRRNLIAPRLPRLAEVTMLESAEAAAARPGSGRRPAAGGAAATPRPYATSTPRCSTGLASCRKFMALEARRYANARARTTRTAARVR